VTDKNWAEFEARLDNSVAPMFQFAQYLHTKGISLEIPGLKKKGQNGVPMDYKDKGDLFIVHNDGRKSRIEVKSITANFTGREDYPFEFIFISSKATVERARDEVERWVILSRDRKYFASIHKDTQDTWFEVEKYASNTRKNEWFYAAPLDVVKWYEMK